MIIHRIVFVNEIQKQTGWLWYIETNYLEVEMETKAKERDLLTIYRMSDCEERLEIVFENYSNFPKMIRKMQKITQYKIKAEKEYIRSHSRGELGVRVQTSILGDATANEAIANVMLEEAFSSGEVTGGLLDGIENAEQYAADIRIIGIMKDDYEIVAECVEDLEDEDSRLMKGYLIEKKFFKELACEFNTSYDTVKRRIRAIKDDIREDIIDCIEMNCRK